MRPAALRLAAVSLLALAAGCSSQNKGKLEGKWESVETTIKDVKHPQGARVIEFKKDDTLTYVVTEAPGQKSETLSGKYECNTGHFVTLKFEEKLNGRKQHVEKIVVEGDELTMTDSDGTSVTFKRVSPPKAE